MTTGTWFPRTFRSDYGVCTACIGGLGAIFSELVVVIGGRTKFGIGAIPAA